MLREVKYGSVVYTDEAPGYNELRDKFIHDVVNKMETYVDGQVHVNGMENFWSLLKRGLKGTYVAVEPFHLFRYLDEQVFRYNNRATKTRHIDDRCRPIQYGHLARSSASASPYAELTGKNRNCDAFLILIAGSEAGSVLRLRPSLVAVRCAFALSLAPTRVLRLPSALAESLAWRSRNVVYSADRLGLDFICPSYTSTKGR